METPPDETRKLPSPEVREERRRRLDALVDKMTETMARNAAQLLATETESDLTPSSVSEDPADDVAGEHDFGAKAALLFNFYEDINIRDTEAALARLAEGVEWAAGVHGVYLHGREAVRAYWTERWSTTTHLLEPREISNAGKGVAAVETRHVIRDLGGVILFDQRVHHSFRIEGGRIVRFDVVDTSGPSSGPRFPS